MRWDELFAELEAELAGAKRQDTEAEVIDMMHAEAATIRLRDRIRHMSGSPINVRLRYGHTRRGVLTEANGTWLLLREDHRRHLVPIEAVAYVWPLRQAAPPLAGIMARLTLGHALRKLAEAGMDLQFLTEGGEITGRIGIVGRDYCDVHTPTGVLAVPWTAILAIDA